MSQKREMGHPAHRDAQDAIYELVIVKDGAKLGEIKPHGNRRYVNRALVTSARDSSHSSFLYPA
jgi:hypothetical protein